MFDPKPKITIEFAKSEYAESLVDNRTLLAVYNLCGPIAKDKLLIPKVVDA